MPFRDDRRRRFRPVVSLALVLLLFFAAASFAEDGGAKGKERELLSHIMQTAKNSLVSVKVELRSPDDRLPSAYRALRIVSKWDDFLSTRQPLYLKGVLVGKDTVLVSEPQLLPEMVGGITVSFFDGEEIEAHLDGLLADSDMWKLGLARPRKSPGVAFRRDYEPRFGDRLFLASLGVFSGGTMYVNLEGMSWTFEATAPYYKIEYADSLVFDSDGRPVGYAPGDGMIRMGDRANWLAGALTGGDVPPARFAELRERFAALLGGDILPVRFELRGKSAGERDPVLFGIAVDGNGTILVPSDFDAARIKNIKGIYVLRNGKEEKADFVGQLKHYFAMLVRLPSIDRPSPVISTGGSVTPLALSALVRPRDFGGETFTFVLPARALGSVSMFDGRRYLSVDLAGGENAFLFGLDGKCRGVLLRHFMVWNEGNPDDCTANRSKSPFRRRRATHIVPFSDIQAMAAAPSKHVVRGLRPMEMHEAKKMVWLGVELQAVNKSLAEYLGILPETKNGRIGGRVVWVYPNSPASRAGLKPGDIILRIKRKDGVTGFDLAVWLLSGWWRNFPWPDRRSGFHRTLAALGTDVPVVVEIVRNGEVKRIETAIEKAPEDFVAARNWKCFELGFRVKNLTYEVRRFFQLPDDFKGVIVYRVESGSKAEVAEMRPLDIIVKVNKRPVSNVEELKRLVLAALEDGTETVNFEILRLGETRFIEVKKPTPEEIEKIREEHRFDTEDEEEE